MKNTILQGDSLEVLKTLPDQCVNMCMTSPPYWALRDYGVDGQLGLEPRFQEYIDNLCNIFDEVKRVLKDDGTCWVNLGDTYFGSGKGAGGDGSNKESFTFKEKEIRVCKHCKKEFIGWKFQSFCGSACSGVDNTPRAKKGKLPDKTLCQIPHRFAIEMCNRGWILRNTIIWHKPNCMPSSVKDRFTVDFEYIFFFSKKKKYYFEQQFRQIKTQENRPNGVIMQRENYNSKYEGGFSYPTKEEWKKADTILFPELLNVHYEIDKIKNNKKGRNKRTTWSINTKSFREAHFAVYPEELCETPIKAGCPEGGIVLDPFFGAGTTGLVALKQNKNFIGIELNKKYVEIANKRLKPYLNQTSLNLYTQ